MLNQKECLNKLLAGISHHDVLKMLKDEPSNDIHMLDVAKDYSLITESEYEQYLESFQKSILLETFFLCVTNSNRLDYFSISDDLSIDMHSLIILLAALERRIRIYDEMSELYKKNNMPNYAYLTNHSAIQLSINNWWHKDDIQNLIQKIKNRDREDEALKQFLQNIYYILNYTKKYSN